MASQQQFRNVDPTIWLEFAGDSFTIPKLHSKVYYFPIGHLEQCPKTPSTQAPSLFSPFIICTVSSVDLLADPETDQIFAKLLLTPVIDATVVPLEVINEEDNGDHVVSCAKTLTISDANNGGAFSVPKACAKLIFPQLDLTTSLPSQELSVTDVCGVVWTFSHVYRGNPKRHLFTTGWSAFVDKKQLVGGDTLVFIKNSAGEIFVGIRRKNMFGAPNKITDQAVINAVELAVKNTPFEVLCYPTVDGFDFVVGDKVFEDAMKIDWKTGMRVTHKVKGRSTFHGTISAISHSHPWCMLEIKWDELNVSENLKYVNPWQIEPDFDIPLLHQLFPPTKRLRVSQEFGLLSDTKRTSSVSMVSLEPLNQTLLNFDGILRDGQNHFSTSTTPNSLKDSSFEKSLMKGSNNVPTEINTSGHIFDNRDNLNSSKTKLIDIHNSNTEIVRPDYIILFGKIVRPAEKNLDDSAIIRADGREMSNKVEDTIKSIEKK
ncbi:unnamed protein product [Vicia faba]|uniref:Auxin response factor n=1 Tax=Vicia faba TaxID=3906 RepID=A0AAV0YNP1_VICFA|nr:unnamed protein product [Vicia faba]